MADKVYRKIVWQLPDISKERIQASYLGSRFDSPSTKLVIKENVTEWFFRAYLSGYNEPNKDSIGLSLCLKKAGSGIFNTKFILGIAGRNGNKEEEFEKPGESFTTDHGAVALLKRDELVDSDQGYLVGGKITFYCKLTITAKEAAESYKTDPLKQNLLGNLKRMMFDETLADFDIETTEKNNEKKVLKAHKCVLGVSSPFFYGMLTTKMKENEINVVKVSEDYVVMKEVLRFIYSSEVENVDEIANELVFAAEKYQLDGLKELCLDSIIKSLTPENVLQTLLAADNLTKSEKLKKKCFEMIYNNFELLRITEDWINLSPGFFSQLIRYIKEIDNAIYV